MKSIEVRLDDETFVDLWAMARRYGTSLEDAARRCIKYVLKEVENPHADPINDPAVRRALKYLLPALEAGEGKDEC